MTSDSQMFNRKRTSEEKSPLKRIAMLFHFLTRKNEDKIVSDEKGHPIVKDTNKEHSRCFDNCKVDPEWRLKMRF